MGGRVASKEQVRMQPEIPIEYQRACEQVREHLVSLRGGAPFMSPADVSLLLDWLDGGLEVVQILLAMERLAEARQKTRSRAPFTLAKVKRHLGRPTHGKLGKVYVAQKLTEAQEHPLAPLVEFLREDAESTAPNPEELEKLAASLEALAPQKPTELAESAIALIRDFHIANWERLDSTEREGYIADALNRLDYVVGETEDAVVLKSAEEVNVSTPGRSIF